MRFFALRHGEHQLHAESGVVSPGFPSPPRLILTEERVVVVARAAGSNGLLAIYDIPRGNTVVPTEVYGDTIVIASNDPRAETFAFRSANPLALIAQLAAWSASTPAQPLPGARVIVHD